MNILLIFFALPLATIIISIALQKIFRNPLLVAAIIFAIFLIVTFVVDDLNFLIATIVYTIIAFITASIVCLICKLIRCFRNNCNNNNDSENDSDNNGENSCNNESAENSVAIAASNNGYNVLNEGVNYNAPYNSQNNCNGTTARVNIIPNYNINEPQYRTYGRYRRR